MSLFVRRVLVVCYVHFPGAAIPQFQARVMRDIPSRFSPTAVHGEKACEGVYTPFCLGPEGSELSLQPPLRSCSSCVLPPGVLLYLPQVSICSGQARAQVLSPFAGDCVSLECGLVHFPGTSGL